MGDRLFKRKNKMWTTQINTCSMNEDLHTAISAWDLFGANWKSWGSDKSDAWKIHMKIKFGRAVRERKMARHGGWVNKVWCAWDWYCARPSAPLARMCVCKQTNKGSENLQILLFIHRHDGNATLHGFYFFLVHSFILRRERAKKCHFYFGRLIIIIKCVHVHNVRSTILPMYIPLDCIHFTHLTFEQQHKNYQHHKKISIQTHRRLPNDRFNVKNHQCWHSLSRHKQHVGMRACECT